MPLRCGALLALLLAAAGMRAPGSHATAADELEANANASPASEGAKGAIPDNVLFVIADDLGVENLHAYGATSVHPHTPCLDRLAAEGVLFEHAWATPLCSPTRASLQTGRHGVRLGLGRLLGHRSAWLADDEVTLAELLATSAGRGGPRWARAFVGKWHLADDEHDELDPNSQGYEHFAGILGGGVRDYRAWSKLVDGEYEVSTTYSTSDQVDEALAWAASAEQPWFLTLSFNAPHYPFHAPPAALHDVDLDGLDPNSEPRPFYEAMIEAMDAELGRFLGALDGDLRARTNVFFLGDNGTPREVAVAPYTPERAKSSLYEGGIHVPFVVAGPVVGAPGRRTAELVHVVDLFPTVAELAGIDPAEVLPAGRRLDGLSLLRVLRGESETPLRARLFTELLKPNSFENLFSEGYAYRDARTKLIVQANGTDDRCFDLERDPAELHDWIAEGFPGDEEEARYRELKRGLAAYLRSL